MTLFNILRVRLPAGASGNTKDCDVMVDQSRAIDNHRFRRHLGALPKLLLEEVEEKLHQVGGF
ncbi:MAG: type II toxin-antitoxin system PemK/MazF family toxin [Deltaproteobacteria bacterium]|nr:type II toxin-antitoxin system PemK/MazF family toxin [Deltaproteobacteria bacterium]